MFKINDCRILGCLKRQKYLYYCRETVNILFISPSPLSLCILGAPIHPCLICSSQLAANLGLSVIHF